MPAVLARQVFGDLLIHLPLEDLLGLSAVQILRRLLRGAQRFEHLFVEGPAHEVLELLAHGKLTRGGSFRGSAAVPVPSVAPATPTAPAIVPTLKLLRSIERIVLLLASAT